MGLFSFFSPKAPPRHIIMLERLNDFTGAKRQSLRVCLWADVPLGFQKFYADPNATSGFLDATSDELKALKSGAIAERIVTLNTVSLATVQEERETLNDAHADYKKVKEGVPLTPDYVMATVDVKTYQQWDDATLDANLGDLWQGFQDEVDAGIKGNADYSAYGESNEAS